jgi:flagellar biosynthesis protein FlhF
MFRHTPQAPPDVYVLTGPTGVGKTTTLAKLAARCVLAEKLNVGLITTDTFRVAAVDQLREYSSLLGVEIAVAFSSEELDAQLRRFHDKDVVFIDTPGRSPYDLEGLQLTRNMLEPFFGRICTLMIFPANIRKDDASALFAAYSCLKPSALIISKTDEASRCDGITTMLECSQLPVLYLTDGQRVPEDIHCASPGLVASLVIPFVKTSEPLKAGGAR